MTHRAYPHTGLHFAALALLAAPGFLFGQAAADVVPPNPEQRSTPQGEWRRVDEPPQKRGPRQSDAASEGMTSQQSAPADTSASVSGPLDEFGMPVRRNLRTADATPVQLPSQLTINPGTFVAVRVNEPLSSDRNQPGDAFSATLARPVVVDGVVVAERGQVVGGRVVETEKAGRVKGVSRLGVELTDLSVADGRQVHIRTQLISRSGPTSQGRDAAAVAGTTGMGAAIGAAADWGRGAAIGAGVGAAAGAIGVLLTRGRETVIYPESVLTFRVEEPVTISTERAPQAFRYVERDDYDRPNELQPRPAPVRAGCGPYGCPPPPYYYYGAPGYPYFYGSGFAFNYGPRFYYGPGWRGHYRGYRR
jgi:hypothetical protein